MQESSRPMLPDCEPSMALIPPFRFANVESGLTRGAYPTLMNFRFLSLLNLKTIVCLVPESPSQDLVDFCSFHEIQCHHVPVTKYNESVTLTKEDMVFILQFLIDNTNMPCYIHCLDGVNITGLVIACFRKLQNWSKSAIVHEFCRFEYGIEMISEEIQFVDDFDGEILVPDEVPQFLWNGLPIVKHPSIKLCHVTTMQDAGSASIPDVDQAGEDADSKTQTHFQPQNELDRDRRRFSQFDILHSNDEDWIHENRRQHEETKKTLSLTVRSMGLESSVAMQFRTRMLSLIDLDSSQSIARSL